MARRSFGLLTGASLTTENAYLIGKFARVCLRTPYIDYNGRLCMVSAAAANKKAFGIDRAANPWSDIVDTKVIWVSGANVAGQPYHLEQGEMILMPANQPDALNATRRFKMMLIMIRS
jgi:anaerobic selenocysteine-containing dehydrogenase